MPADGLVFHVRCPFEPPHGGSLENRKRERKSPMVGKIFWGAGLRTATEALSAAGGPGIEGCFRAAGTRGRPDAPPRAYCYPAAPPSIPRTQATCPAGRTSCKTPEARLGRSPFATAPPPDRPTAARPPGNFPGRRPLNCLPDFRGMATHPPAEVDVQSFLEHPLLD